MNGRILTKSVNPDGGLVVSFIWPGGEIPYDDS